MSEVPDRCVEFRVSGRVQGVGFRYFTEREARRLGVRGWVRNMPDGSVTVVAQASEAVLSELEELLRRGPRHAHVESLEKSERAGESYDDFDVRF